MDLQTAYHILYLAVVIALGLMIGTVLIRSVIGPRITDRILSINMLGTMVICTIAVLAEYLQETYLLDVALIYAMISFVAVLMLAMTYIPPKPERKDFPSEEKAAALPARENHKKRKRRAKR